MEETKETKAPKVPKCPECKFRIRGKNHKEGHHHKGKVPKNG